MEVAGFITILLTICATGVGIVAILKTDMSNLRADMKEDMSNFEKRIEKLDERWEKLDQRWIDLFKDVWKVKLDKERP